MKEFEEEETHRIAQDAKDEGARPLFPAVNVDVGDESPLLHHQQGRQGQSRRKDHRHNRCQDFTRPLSIRVGRNDDEKRHHRIDERVEDIRQDT